MTNFLSANGVSNMGGDIAFIVIFALLSVVVILLAVWLLTKFIRKPKYAEVYAAKLKAFELGAEKSARPVKFNFTGILFAIMGLGFLVRAVMMLTMIGYREDISGLYELMMTASPTYGAEGTIAHYPVVVGIYWFIGLIGRGVGLTADSLVVPVLVKLPLIIADMFLVYVVYRAAAKHINEYAALVLAGLVALFPAFVLSSGVWGSVYTILALMLTCTFYFMANRKFLLMMLFYALALYTAKDALYLFPIVAIFVIYQWVRALKYMRKEGISGVGAIMKDINARPVLMLPIYFIAAWIVMWLTALPLVIEFSAGPFGWLNLFYLKPLGNFSMFGYNAMNVYNLFIDIAGNGITLGTNFPAGLFGGLFMMIVTVLVLLVYLSRKNRANLIYLAAYIILTLSIYFVDFTAMNLISALALLMLAVIFVRDRRILLICGLLGLVVTLNASFVMMSAGYLNNKLPSDFAAAAYTGSTLLANGGWLAASITLSLFALAIHAYATVVILDIAMSNKRRLFAEIPEPVGFGKSLKRFMKG